jgi:CHAT domain-containing protein/tetratricopeptide (TPR) repeat protein
MNKYFYVLLVLLFINIRSIAQTWNEMENDFNNFASEKKFEKANEIANKMEKYALENHTNSSVLLAEAYYNKLILALNINPSDTLWLYYSNKLTNEITTLAYGQNKRSIKPLLSEFINLLEQHPSHKTYLYSIYCPNIISLANIYDSEGNTAQAIELYEKSITILRDHKSRGADYCLALVFYAQLLYRENELDKSKSLFIEAISIYDEANIISDFFNPALIGASNIMIIEANYVEAELLLNKYRVKYDNSPKDLDYIIFYEQLALVKTFSGVYNDALKIYTDLSLIKTLTDFDYFQIQLELGQLYFKMSRYDSAESKYLNLLDWNKKNENPLDDASILNSLGVLNAHIGNNQIAETYFLEAIKIRKDKLNTSHPIYAASLFDLSFVYRNMGNYSNAESLLKESIDIRNSVFGENNQYSVESYAELAILYQIQYKPALAIEYYDKVIKYYSQKNLNSTPQYYLYLSNIASLNIDLKNYEIAEKELLIILDNTNKESGNYAGFLANLANLYASRGDVRDFVKSENYFLLADKKYIILYGENSHVRLLNLSNLAFLYEQSGEFLKANKILVDLLNSTKNELNSNFQWISSDEKNLYWNMIEYMFSRNHLFSAKSNKVLPESSILSFDANLISQSLLLQSTNYFNTIILRTGNVSLINEFNDFKKINTQLAKLTSEGSGNIELISKLEHQADSLDQLLSRKMSSYADYKKNFSLTWKDVQLNLSNDEAAIEFARYYDDKDSAYHYLALIVKQGDKYPALVKLCSEDELKRFSPEKELNDLYSLLWKPISSQLTGIKTIYYTPAGLMNNIPFQALYEDKTEGREYLMDKYSLNQLTSTRYLALGLKKRAEELIETNIALFGGVNYNDLPDSKSDTSNYLSSEAAFLYKNAITNRDIEDTRSGASYLPGTKKEVENIGDLLKSNKWDVNVIEGKNASEDKVKNLAGKNSKSILHIATHGFAFPDKENNKKRNEIGLENGNERYKVAENPMIRSGLLFSGSNMTWQGKGDSLLKITNEDGVLTAYELSQLSLDNTKLVVLSACETGKGAIQGSEGTFGLKRALKLAGVDNMIVSLWKVPDDATMEMMTLFYTELAKTKLPVPAFELAQKSMRNKYPTELKKWAGFVFVR